VAPVALNAARFLGRSRKISLFAALVAAAGFVNELQRRRESDGSKQADEG
jgi:hypothetical protein